MKLLPVALLALPLAACLSSSDTPGGGPAVCTPGATEPCYSGPASTLDVGACHGGVRTCAADGQGFGACESEVVPQPESCGSTVDVDCNGTTGGCSGEALWKLPITGTPELGGVAASDDGEIAIFGWAQSIDIGTGAEGDGTTWALFAAGIGADGTPRWLSTFPGVTASTHAGAIVMSPDHVATVVVYAEGPVTIGAVPVAAPAESVIAIRLGDGGAVQAGGPVDLSGAPATLSPWVDVARLEGDGSVIVGGAGFLAEIGPGLDTSWHHRYAGDVTFADLSFAEDGSLFAAGSYEGSFEPGGGATPVSGNHAGFVAQLDGQNVAWSETLGGDTETAALSVAALPDYYGVLWVGGVQASGGDLIGGEPSTAALGFLAQRDVDRAVASSVFGWGPSSPSTTMDAAGDAVVRVVGTGQWSPHAIFKTNADTGVGELSGDYWTQVFAWPLVSATLPTGETIVATQAGVQKLGR